MRFEDTILATGTGLVAYIGHSPFLVTALHNFTGRESDGKCKDQHGGVPNFVTVSGFNYHCEFPLFKEDNDPNIDIPLFWFHPGGPTYDIAILPIRGIESPSILHPSFLDPVESGRSVRVHVAQMCFVVGYPEGVYVDVPPLGVSPIWKTGHVASEPALRVNNQDKIYIDAATRPGMSGSPVYLIEPDRYRRSTVHRLLGIYTGRTSDLSDVGFVFTAEAIWAAHQAGIPMERIEYPPQRPAST
jgi:hypothetical protein